MTCAPQLPADTIPATLDEAVDALAIQRQQIEQARNILNAGGELPQLGYTEGPVTVDDGLVVVPLSTALSTARLVMAPAVAERFAARLNTAIAKQRTGCTCQDASD